MATNRIETLDPALIRPGTWFFSILVVTCYVVYTYYACSLFCFKILVLHVHVLVNHLYSTVEDTKKVTFRPYKTEKKLTV